jgi:RecA-family ATPase
LKVIKLGELVTKKLTIPPSIMGDGLLITNGRAILYGPPGAFKTYFAQQLCHALAAGEDFFGYKVHRAITTLMVEIEMTEPFMQMRVRAMVAKQDWDVGDRENFVLTHDFTLDGPAAAQQLTDVVVETGAEFVVIDPLNLVMMGTENSDEHARNFLKLVNTIRGVTGAAFLIIHHANKGYWHDGQKINRGGADLSGNKAFWAWVDTLFRLEPIPERKATTQLTWEKVRNGPEPPNQWLQFRDGVLEQAEEDPVKTLTKALMDMPLTISEADTILEECGLSYRRRREIRERMVNDGTVSLRMNPANKKSKLMVLV